MRIKYPPLMLLVLAFFFNSSVLNERSDIYRKSFHLKLDLKTRFFPLKSSKIHLCPTFPILGACGWAPKYIFEILGAPGSYSRRQNATFCTLGVPRHTRDTWSMAQEPHCIILCVNVCFFIFFSICFRIRCVWTWEHNSSLCN